MNRGVSPTGTWRGRFRAILCVPLALFSLACSEDEPWGGRFTLEGTVQDSGMGCILLYANGQPQELCFAGYSYDEVGSSCGRVLSA